jgi:hypothetical protein
VNRREFVTAVGASGLLAGCLSGRIADGGDGTGGSTSATPTRAPAAPSGTTPSPAETATQATDGATIEAENTRLARHGIPATICETSIDPDPGIYAIVAPAFADDWSVHGIAPAYRNEEDREGLVDEQTVIALTADGLARAYPLTVLNTHEVVNDRLGPGDAVGGAGSAGTGEPVIVTFCPLCASGMVATRRVGGEATRFAVTGELWMPERAFERASEEAGHTFGATHSGGEEIAVKHNGNLVMYDAATRSYWSQILARGICGPETGTELEIRPSTVTTWAEFRERHPGGDVLLPPPHSETVEPGARLG